LTSPERMKKTATQLLPPVKSSRTKGSWANLGYPASLQQAGINSRWKDSVRCSATTRHAAIPLKPLTKLGLGMVLIKANLSTHINPFGIFNGT